jgi:diaminopimelate decarboxylase
MTMLLDGISSILELVEEINVSLKRANIKKRIRIFDMGGGLPVSYHYGEIPVSMEEYKNALYARFERLFSDEFRLITEFGRYVHANPGFTASRVEYVKMDRTINTAMIHVGADMFLRKCYRPDEWHHDITIVDKYGNIKTSGNARYNIAGPLCFAGDIIASGISLPTIAEGDYVLIHDTGAYTLSMWSRYNSRQIPKVVGVSGNKNKFEILRKRETTEMLFNFWK